MRSIEGLKEDKTIFFAFYATGTNCKSKFRMAPNPTGARQVTVRMDPAILYVSLYVSYVRCEFRLTLSTPRTCSVSAGFDG